MPLREIDRIDDFVDCEGWLDNDTFVLTQQIKVRKIDGVPYDALSSEERDILDADSSLTDDLIKKINYQVKPADKDA